MNPWPASASASSAPSWSADLRSALPDTDFGEPVSTSSLQAAAADPTRSAASETFLVEWEHLPSHFEALQINWDPDRFEETTSAH